MARPTVLHQGFFVPNAQDVTKPELAEPDRIDFNISGNARWGVLSGCLVTVSGATASNTAGTALVNGVLVDVVAGQNTSVGSGGTQNRFDLIGVDSTGKLVTVSGSPSLDPVFPDPPLTVTALAAVLASAGVSDYSDQVVDKRNMLADSLKTKLSPDADLIFNRNGSGNLFHVDGAGKTTWEADVSIERIDFGPTGALRITPNLSVDDAIAAGGNITAAKNLTATLKVSGSNLRNTSALPSDASGSAGDLFTHTSTGKAYIHQGGKWEEIATLKSSVPTGTIVTSLQAPSYMTGLGWVSLDGSVVTETEVPSLFTIPALAIYISGGTPRTMALPDARRRVLLYSPDDIGRVGGANSLTIGLANMPPHIHNTRVQAGGGANPQVRLSRAGQHRHNIYGGAHGHSLDDPTHSHNGTDHPLGNQFVSLAWGGNNKVDALFNDRSHTYSVEAAEWTKPALTGITVLAAGSEHGHGMDDQGDHDHQATIDAIPAHPHGVQEDYVGGGAAIPITPAYLAVYCYIRG